MIDVFTLIAHQKTTGFDNTNPMDNDLCKLTAMFVFDAANWGVKLVSFWC